MQKMGELCSWNYHVIGVDTVQHIRLTQEMFKFTRNGGFITGSAFDGIDLCRKDALGVE